MKILHCNTYDSGGGAAIAAKRLHAALLDEGVDSRLGVLRRNGDAPGVFSLAGPCRRALQPLAIRLEHAPLRLCGQAKNAPLFSLGNVPSCAHKGINADSADIVHAHWITDSLIPVGTLGRIRKPLVWTLHDTWAFTAGCHILQGCEQYKESCAHCPQVPARARWLVRRAFRARQRSYAKIQPYIVTPSKAMQCTVAQSTLLGEAPQRCIPHGIDDTLFFPLEKTRARYALNVPQDEKIVAFGAVNALSDPNKGFDLLAQALATLPHLLKAPVRLRLLVFGASRTEEAFGAFPATCLGRLHDDISLRLVYSAADVFVCPSREESFSLTTLESLACGTPVAAFSVGGIPDMVEQGVNGCLATPHDPEELARGIAHILEDDPRRARMGEAARKVVEERYAAPVVARLHLALYEEVLAEHGGR